MRIGIANDCMIALEALRRVLASRPEHEVAWVARTGLEAIDCCLADTPDLVLMDLMMPVMDGVEATRRIMKEAPCAILVVTATVTGSTDAVFEAMGHGALDAVDTPVLGRDDLEGGRALLAKINIIARLLGKTSGSRKTSRPTQNSSDGTNPPLIAIGASTGGPAALAEILSRLPSGFGAAVVIVQHVDARFAAGMSEWLSGRCPLEVRLLQPGDRPGPGTVWLAGTNDHLVLMPDLTFEYTPEPVKSPYRPSVDVFFESLAAHWPSKGTAVLLTGMGKDGAEGLLTLRRAGWQTIAQEEKSCVVYGMPKAAAEIGAAVRIARPDEIALHLSRVYAKREMGVAPR